MFARSNPAAGPVPLPAYVRKIAMVCDMHGVAYGSASHLPGFLRALEENKHLAMDFWSLVARMSDSDSAAAVELIHGKMSDENRMLAVIVEGVTGRTVAQVVGAGHPERLAVGELAGLLSGQDTARQAAPQERPRVAAAASFADAVAAASVVPSSEAAVPVDAVPLAAASPQESVPPATPPPVEPALEAAAEAPIEKREELPQKSSVTAKRTAPLGVPTVPLVVQPEPMLAQPLVPAVVHDENRRLVLEPEVVLADEAAAGTNRASLRPAERPLFLALSGYADEKESAGRSGVWIGLLVLLLAMGGGVFYVQHGGAANWQRVKAWVQTGPVGILHGIPPKKAADATATGDGASGASSAPGAMSPEQSTSAETPSTENRADLPQASETGKPQSEAGSATAGPSTAAPGAAALNQSRGTSTSLNAPKGASGAVPGSAPSGPGGLAQSGALGGSPGSAAAGEAPLVVPAGVMKANLLSSRPPAYPEAAREEHLEGRVVMQATITRGGRVGHLHVVSGDAALRAAAIAAVVGWQYRPYMVDGQAVPVSTTISVDFLLDQ